MSAEATGWVWKHSPYRGAEMLVHLAVADVVNDAHGNEFWMSIGSLAGKAKVSRSTASGALQRMTNEGYLDLLESGEAQRKPSRYRMTRPDSDLASATTGLASAVSDLALARSPRANSIELKKLKEEPTSAISGLGTKAPPPWVAVGLSRADWNAQHAPRNNDKPL